MSTSVADAASGLLLQSYEAFPYDSRAVPASHPDTLATAARLRGLVTPPVADCRVLELGCGTGGNIIPMALGLPRATFVGIDLSPRQVGLGEAMVRALGLDNVRLEARSIADVGDDAGTFDYIICHGVYSWVPSDVQAAVLRICARNLAPTGVAYISYNTFPGWHIRGMVRDLVLFHDEPGLLPGARVARGREVAEFIARAIPDQESVHAAVLREELETLREADDSYFLHEELETVNEPIYFTEFARRLDEAGLRYVAEAQPSALTARLSGETRARVREWAGDEIRYEQYVDFLCNRTFRRSVICHAAIPVAHQPLASAVPALLLSARCTVDLSAAAPPDAEVFRTLKGLAVTIAHPLVRAALHTLLEARPGALAFADLQARTGERLARGSPEPNATYGGPAQLADAMLQSALLRLVDLHVAPPPCATRLGARPIVSPLARLQARSGSRVTTLTQLSVDLAPFDRLVLTHADGTRDARALSDVVHEAVRRGELSLGEGAPPTADGIAAGVDRALRNFLDVGLVA